MATVASAAPIVSASAAPVDAIGSRKVKLADPGYAGAVLKLVDGATVVGLGEQTHGSEANARVRVDLVKLLVDKGDVRVVALEADYVETLRLEAYLQGGAGEPEALLGQQRAGWIWNKPALRELVVWLRERNASRPEGERVHVVGVDMQTAPVIVEAVAAALDARGTEAKLKKKLAGIEACDARLAPLLPELDLLVASRAALAPLVRSLRQCQAVSKEGPEGTAAREKGMAENTVAVAEANGGRRVVVLAHDGHVAKVALVPNDPPSMGTRLQEKLGEGYVAIGTVIGSGDFRGYRLDPKAGRSAKTEMLPLGEPAPDWVEGWLKSPDAYFLPLRGFTGDERKMRVVGASYAPDYADHFVFPVHVERAFDALIYLPRA